MSGFTKFLKWLAGFFGAILMVAGFLVFFVGLVANNMMANVDNFDKITEQSLNRFVEENRDDIRSFVQEKVLEQVGSGFDDITREQFILMCSQPNVMNVDGDGSIEFQNLLKTEVCPGIEQKSLEDIKKGAVDAMVTQNIDKVLAEINKNADVKQALEQSKAVFDSSRLIIFGGSIFVWLIGVFLVLVGAGFNWKRFAYNITMQTALNLLAVGLVFMYIGSLTPDSIVKLIDSLHGSLPQIAATNAPPLIIKLGATIVLSWLHAGMKPLIPIAFIAAIPFAAIAIWLLILRAKEKKALKAGGKAEVV